MGRRSRWCHPRPETLLGGAIPSPARPAPPGASYHTPARGEFAVTVDLADRSEARVEVYDLRGAIVRTLMTGVHPAGRFDLVWDGRDERGRLAPNGLYLMRMRTR